MEQSSPLAAMQPPSVLFGHCFRPDAPTSFPAMGSMTSFGPNSFNFKDLSMKKSHSDYFNMRPVQGSSPTASLAADLSQNFRIDQSPQLATPRRSLFSACLFGAGNGYDESMTTPPLPSSSPAPAMDTMDMSPLPHKPPFIVTTDVDLDLNSPTPDSSATDSPMFSTATTPLTEPSLEDQTEVAQEKRRPTFTRPSLIRTKANSTFLGVSKPAAESLAPPFKFGSGVTRTSLSASPSLEDMFAESPPSDRTGLRITTSSSNVMNTARLRPPYVSHGSLSRSSSGSPGHAAIRKHPIPSARPRKQCRRSLSMFEHPEDIMCEKEAKITTNAPLQSIADVEGTPELQLPHFIPDEQGDSLPRIDKAILVDLMDGKYSDRFENVMIVDCRFEYEFEGGHIDGAVNYNDKEHLAAKLFALPMPRTALVLHCEYSAHRAPLMAKYIRHRDRAVNVDNYPNLTYPDMYILDGGYSAFFASHRSLCFPQNYVEMAAKEHEFACERGLGKVKQRSKLSRAQTFAFGQQSPQMEDSPTGRCRGNNNNNYLSDRNRLLESPFNDSPGSSRFAGRRMLSY